MANGFGSFGAGLSPIMQALYARALMQNMPGGGGGNQTATDLNKAQLARLNADPSTAFSDPSVVTPYSPMAAGTNPYYPGGTPGYTPAAGTTATRPDIPPLPSPSQGSAQITGGMFPQPVPYASTLPGGANAVPIARPVVTPSAATAGAFNPNAIPTALRPAISAQTGLPIPPAAANPPANIPGLGPTPMAAATVVPSRPGLDFSFNPPAAARWSAGWRGRPGLDMSLSPPVGGAAGAANPAYAAWLQRFGGFAPGI